jgi:small redox-active disulfide protein 2
MKDIKVLGSGCAKCKRTLEAIAEVAQHEGVPVNLQKVEDIRDIMAYRVLSTPGVVVDGKVVHVGSVPSAALITSWLH